MQMHGHELHLPLHLDAYLHCVYPGLATTTHSGMPAEEPECIECNEAKQSAEARAAATASGGGTLQLGECQPLYEAWTDCIKVSSNQATGLPGCTTGGAQR